MKSLDSASFGLGDKEASGEDGGLPAGLQIYVYRTVARKAQTYIAKK